MECHLKLRLSVPFTEVFIKKKVVHGQNKISLKKKTFILLFDYKFDFDFDFDFSLLNLFKNVLII